MSLDESSSARRSRVYPKLSTQSTDNNHGEPLLSSNTNTVTLTNDHKPLTKRTQQTTYDPEQIKTNVEVAATYIEDAIHVRRPQTRIQEPGLQFNCCGKIIPCLSPLKAYRFTHNAHWKTFLFLIIWIHLLLIIYAPKNHDKPGPDHYDHIMTWVLWAQLLCLLVFVIDCGLRVYAHDHEFRNNPWQRMLYFVIFINTFHVTLSLIGGDMDQRIILFAQIFRPYYLIYNGRSLRTVVKSILRSVPRIMILLWLIAFTVSAFGMLGYELMYDISNSNFNTFEESLLSLMILLTTANFPDVMMPAFHSSPYYVIYFACFVIIILVLFLPTLLAVIYETYHTQTEKQYAKIVRIHSNALLSAFELLTRDSTNCTVYTYQSVDYGADGDENEMNQQVITKDVWLQLMRIIRPDLDQTGHEVLFTTLRLSEDDLTSHPNEVEYRLNSVDEPDGITKKQFLRLPEFIEIKFHVSAKAGAAHDLVSLQNQYIKYLKHKRTRTIKNKLMAWETKLRVYLLYIFYHPLAEGIIDWMVWFTAMSLVAEKFASDYFDDDDIVSTFSYVHQTFLVIFVCEIILKIYAFGVKAFISDSFYVFDAILVGIGVGVLVHERGNDTDSWVTLIRTLRLLRVIKQFPQVQLLSLFFKALMRSFVILLLAQFCVFYVFSQIGMILFDGLISYNKIWNEMLADHNTDYWQGVIGVDVDGNAVPFTHPFYWLNNMNSFIHTMIVLMELSVVNNWQCVMEMYIMMTGNHYNRIFFISFYFCSVIIVLNVVVAFVINLFLVNYGQNISSNDLLFRYKRYIVMSILIHNLNNNAYDISHWTIERRARAALWYQVIFEDKVNTSIENANKAAITGEIDNFIDYDDVIQMPLIQGNIIEQFKDFSLQTRRQEDSLNNININSTPITMSNTFVTPINNNNAQFDFFGSSLNASYQQQYKNSLNPFPQRSPQQPVPAIQRIDSQFSVVE